MSALRARGRLARLLALMVACPLVLVAATVSNTGAGAAPAFSKTVTDTRAHIIDGAEAPVDSRTVSVNVDQTQGLRDRQAINVTWSGAHPTGGLVADTNSAAAAGQEYPVVVMQCRGVDDPSAPAASQLSPQTCWTQTPAERFEGDTTGYAYPPFRMDRYAAPGDRGLLAGAPDPYPTTCDGTGGAEHWVPFIAADGTVYPGGNQGCAGLAPEAANAAASLQPGSTTYGQTDAQGNGAVKFIVQNADANASLGCSDTVVCSLVIIPIMGLSCDPAGTGNPDDTASGMPAVDRPTADLLDLIQTGNPVHPGCGGTGVFAPGSFNLAGSTADLAVTGSLWWSASNWRGRITVPLTFAASSSVCNVLSSNTAEIDIYGAQAMLQATQQWSPAFCLDPKLFAVKHVQTSEPQAKNLLDLGSIQAAFVGAPPDQAFRKPIVQAPAAVSGFAVSFAVDGADGKPLTNLNLNARLLAKLLSESYPSNTVVQLAYPALGHNPLDLGKDPEFQALNPTAIKSSYVLEAASTISITAQDSDVITALTSYINSDPEARAWLDGTPDPWGMVVNPHYKKIALPVDSWPQLDTFEPILNGNPCYSLSPVPWLPLVASPIGNPSSITLNMQFSIANSQILCQNAGSANQKLVSYGRESPGSTFLLGVVSLADAERYQLNTASLQTTSSAPGTGEFSDATGRTFVGPSAASLKAAAALLTFDKGLGTWALPYASLHSAIGVGAYPGTMLLSVDVPTAGLAKADAARFATFLRFVATTGQKPGIGVGLLPPGYLSLTADNGLGQLAAYTQAAATQVENQSGTVLVPSTLRPSTSFGPPTVAPGPTTVGPNGSPTATGAPSTSTGATPSSTAASGKPSTSLTIDAVSSAKTAKISSGPLGVALPILLIFALLSAGASAWISRVGRR